MKLLLDTNVISDFVRGVVNVQARLRACAAIDLAVSTVTLMEIEYGLTRNEARARRIAPVISALLGSLSILPYSDADARQTGRIRAELERAGTPIGLCDAMLAGAARERGLCIVTHNVAEFARVENLNIQDWHTATT
jgi:tRNA(fMet)-specific endonuclease VapC